MTQYRVIIYFMIHYIALPTEGLLGMPQHLNTRQHSVRVRLNGKKTSRGDQSLRE